jgi:hypothetical protein
MTAPSDQHEERVAVLETMALLAGVTQLLHLPGDGRPDVARISVDGAVVLVADAKDTETPGCSETSRRLRRYARALRDLIEGAVAVRLAICHGRPAATHEWERTLSCVARDVGLRQSAAGSCAVDGHTVVAWIDLQLPADRIGLVRDAPVEYLTFEGRFSRQPDDRLAPVTVSSG